MRGFLAKSGASQSIVDDLVDRGLLNSETFAGHRYKVQRFYKRDRCVDTVFNIENERERGSEEVDFQFDLKNGSGIEKLMLQG